jgi:hypothetical protein
MVICANFAVLRSVDGVSSWARAMRLCLCVALVGISIQSAAETKEPDSSEGRSPDSFSSCVALGGRVEGNGQARCITATGTTFTEPAKAGRAACKDLCGDGTCQEMVCMALGCPCAESATSCPSDCNEH